MEQLVEQLTHEIDSLMISDEAKADLYCQLHDLADTTTEQNLERLFKAILYEQEKLHA